MTNTTADPESPISDTAFDEIIAGLSAGLHEEIRAVQQELKRWGGDDPPPIIAGTYEGYDEHHIYRLRLKHPLFPPENTGVTLELGSERARGWVDEVEPDGCALWVLLEDRLKASPKEYGLSFDPTFVLERTLYELEDLKSEKKHVGAVPVARLFGLRPASIDIGPEPPAEIRDGLNEDQVRLIRAIDASNLIVGFGPPGTGKTRTGAAAIAHLAANRELRVLVTAHTNTALDTIMAAVVDRLPDWASKGRILRSGRLSRGFQHLGIRAKDFQARAYAANAAEFEAELSAIELEADQIAPATQAGFSGATGAFAALRQRRERSLSRKRRAKGPLERINTLLARIANSGAPEASSLLTRTEKLRERLQDIAGRPEKTARIVGATFSKLAVDAEAFNRYDVVVADEASMATLAQLAIAAARSNAKLLVLGDPCQLPPIVQSRSRSAQNWLRRNAYQQLGLEDPATAATDPRCVMLRTQYRMAPPIRTLVSNMFYAGLLVDAPSVIRANEPVELHLIDTSEYGIVEVYQDGAEFYHENLSESSGKSRINMVHADLVGRLARQLHDEGETDIAIISPFNAQTKIVRDALREHGIAGRFWALGGTISTVHRAQGGERDVVLLDLVDAPGNSGNHRAMSSFLDASWNADLPNLINVAISRARRRLIVVAHAEGFRQRYGPGSLIFDLLVHMYRGGSYSRLKPVRIDPSQNMATAISERQLASPRRRI